MDVKLHDPYPRFRFDLSSSIFLGNFFFLSQTLFEVHVYNETLLVYHVFLLFGRMWRLFFWFFFVCVKTKKKYFTKEVSEDFFFYVGAEGGGRCLRTLSTP